MGGSREKRAMPPRLKICVTAALVLVTGGSAVDAQYVDDSNPSTYWRLERQRMQERQIRPQAAPPRQRPRHLIRGAAPRRGYIPAPARAPEPTEAAGHSNPAGAQPGASGATDDASRQADVQKPETPRGPAFTITVLGDNVGMLLAQGLQDAFADRPEITVDRKARQNTGLVRDDYFDWTAEVGKLLEKPEEIDAAVMMIGSNDRQPIRDNGENVDIRSPRWKELYTQRVEGIVKLFREKNVPLIWVGMPVMKNDRLSSGLLEQNEIYRDAVAGTGATYVDVWEAFVDDRQQFALYGPDVNGRTTKLRTGDGVHFTKAGARKLAHFVESDIKRLIERARPTESAPVAAVAPGAQSGPSEVRVMVPTNAQDADAGETSRQLAIPLPPPAPMIVIPVRPAAGPVLPLTSAAISPGGELAVPRREADARDRSARAIFEAGVVEGRPLQTRKGRADDFSWPRN